MIQNELNIKMEVEMENEIKEVKEIKEEKEEGNQFVDCFEF